MVYNQKLVANVKCAGKIMREQDDTVFLPFGEEYSLLLKNLNTQRAVIHIEIDGEQVVPDGLILNANQTIDLERFIVNSNLNKGPRFRFIEKTEEISDHRGDKIDDGIIRISYQFEKVVVCNVDYTPTWDCGGGTYYKTNYGRNSGDVDGHIYTASTDILRGQAINIGSTTSIASNDVGITVKGSESTQKFSTTTAGLLEAAKHVIVLNLKGQINNEPVCAPVTVSRKIRCDTCGKPNISSNTFCNKCGTNLTYQY